MTVLLHGVYERDPNVITREIAGERILVPVQKRAADMAAIYVLNETGACLWNLLDGMRTLSDVETVMAGDYDVPQETVRADILALVSELEDLGMLRLIEHAL